MGFIDAPMGKTERAGTLWRPDRVTVAPRRAASSRPGGRLSTLRPGRWIMVRVRLTGSGARGLGSGMRGEGEDEGSGACGGHRSRAGGGRDVRHR